MTRVARVAAIFRRRQEARETDAEALRVARVREAARAEIEVFLAAHEVSSLAAPKCAALVRAWSALASMESLVRSDGAAGAPARVAGVLADVPDAFVASVLAGAQSEPGDPVSVPSDRQFDGQRRWLLREFTRLERRAKRSSPGAGPPWRGWRRTGIVAVALALASISVGFAFYRPRWRASYYENEALSGEPSVVTRTLDADHYWGYGGPGLAMPTDHFSARFETCLAMDRPATVVFTVGSDDGARLFVDERRVIDAWSAQRYTEHVQPLALAAGVHALRLEYFEREGQARLTFAGRIESSGADIAEMLRLPADAAPASVPCRATSL
jgi:PA14 domain